MKKTPAALRRQKLIRGKLKLHPLPPKPLEEARAKAIKKYSKPVPSLEQIEEKMLQHFALMEKQHESEIAEARLWVEKGWKISVQLNVSDSAFEALIGHNTEIIQHLRTLLLMVLDFTPNGNDDSPFLGSYKNKAQQIGHSLNKLGGGDLMYAIADKIPRRYQRDLDYAWDGIGSWRA